MIRNPWRLFLPILLGLVTAPASAAEEQTEHTVLGTVHFPVNCTAEAQQAFDEAALSLGQSIVTGSCTRKASASPPNTRPTKSRTSPTI